MRRVLVIAGMAASLILLSVAATTAQSAMDPREAIDLATGQSGEANSLPAYWTEILATSNLGEYRDPTVAELVSTSSGSINACETPTEDVWNNALYCFEDESIAYDPSLLFSVHEEYGAASTFAILAHEWGHHIQNLTRLADYSKQSELQADCYAGMYIKHLIEEGVLHEADVLTSLASTESFGDDQLGVSSYTDWKDSDVHGDRNERRQAFGIGYSTQHLAYCRAYDAWHPEDPVDLTDPTNPMATRRELALPPGSTRGKRGDARTIETVDANVDVWRQSQAPTAVPAQMLGVLAAEAYPADSVEVSPATEGWLERRGWADGRGALAYVYRVGSDGSTEVGAAALQIHDDGSSELFIAFPKPGQPDDPIRVAVRALAALAWGYCDRSSPAPDNCPPVVEVEPIDDLLPPPATPRPQTPDAPMPLPDNPRLPNSGASAEELRQVLLATHRPLLDTAAQARCGDWYPRQEAGDAFSPFTDTEPGADAAIICKEPGNGVARMAVYQFPSREALQRQWNNRLRGIEPAVSDRTDACEFGARGVGGWDDGEFACYLDDEEVPRLKWINRQNLTYGIADADSDAVTIQQLFNWWWGHTP